ncbi:MAG: hypothetical protein IPM98_05845 [Lewinellaceae bacterium]|nr:hypothetical protein [Lewinellaceae bacterium]
MEEYTTVYGIIDEISLKEIPNKAIGGNAKIETKIQLNVTEVYDYQNNPIKLAEFDYPIFAGSKDLINSFNKGDNVKITCSSKTGRHIKTIEKIK